jgi:hypothetical protein
MSGETIPVVRALIDELEANRSMFEALCVACRGSDLERTAPDGEWTVLEHIAHLASYDVLAIRQVEHARLVQAGASSPEEAGLPDAPALPEGDAWNEAQVARRAGRSLAVHLGEMEGLRQRVLPLVDGLNARALAREVQFPGDAQRNPGAVPLRLWLERWSKHDMIHAREMLQAIPEIGASSDFRSWLADDPLLEALHRGDEIRRDRDPGRGGEQR